eukprot:366135-Chlamydomonas_euryale.AAC.2
MWHGLWGQGLCLNARVLDQLPAWLLSAWHLSAWVLPVCILCSCAVSACSSPCMRPLHGFCLHGAPARALSAWVLLHGFCLHGAPARALSAWVLLHGIPRARYSDSLHRVFLHTGSCTPAAVRWLHGAIACTRNGSLY